MNRSRLSRSDLALVILAAAGAAFTVSGASRLLRDASDVRGENAFVIGVGMLLPLAVIVALRFLTAKPRDH